MRIIQSAMTDYKPNFPSLMLNTDVSLASELSNSYSHLEAICCQQAKATEAEVNGWVNGPFSHITLSEHDIRRAFKCVNIKKATANYVLTN